MNYLQCLQKTGFTLNRQKFQSSVTQVTFIGHHINGSGIQPDPDKVKAVQIMQVALMFQ